MGTAGRTIAGATLAGAALGAWAGIADGVRMALAGPRPFTPADFALLVPAWAGVLTALGFLGGCAAALRRASPPAARLATALALAAATLGSFLRFSGMQSWESGGAGAAIKAGVALALGVAAFASWRALRRRGRDPLALRPLATAAVLLLPAAAAGLASLLPAAPLPDLFPPGVVSRGGTPRRNVLVVLVDTLRTDRVGACGGPEGLTPRLDAFAREGTAFLQARTSSPWTLPAAVSLFTGLRPERHGVVTMTFSVPPRCPALPSFFRAVGYRTALLSASEFVCPDFGFGRGVDGLLLVPEAGDLRGSVPWLTLVDLEARLRALRGDDAPRHSPWHRRADELAARFLGWVDGVGQDPWCACLHWVEPHAPYAPARPSTPGRRPSGGFEMYRVVPFDEAPAHAPEEVRDALANYDDEVREADAAFGLLVDGLRARGLLDRTVVAFLADHGEEFHEHGAWVHQHSLFEEVVRVPLVLRDPGGRGRGRRVAEPVRIEDVLPTLLDLSGLATDAAFDGRSLLPLMEGRPEAGRPWTGLLEQGSTTLRGALAEGAKLVLGERGEKRSARMYDLGKDPGETRDLAGTGDPREAGLRQMVEESIRLSKEGPQPPWSTLSGPAMDALRALGYVGGGK